MLLFRGRGAALYPVRPRFGPFSWPGGWFCPVRPRFGPFSWPDPTVSASPSTFSAIFVAGRVVLPSSSTFWAVFVAGPHRFGLSVHVLSRFRGRTPPFRPLRPRFEPFSWPGPWGSVGTGAVCGRGVKQKTPCKMQGVLSGADEARTRDPRRDR